MSLPRFRRRAVLLGVAVLLALFLFRPGAARLKSRISGSIGGALQRPVEISSVHLHVLPRPGFDLENFIVHDDPAFGAEPVLRAQEVTASLRILALLRGRIEISRLSLTEPSLNLVRNAQGHWNIENILEHTAQAPIAPTGKRPAAGRIAFPYIEADHGRINFKLGPEKKPFTLTEADYSFWQDTDSSWGTRLKAQPLRTDFNLSDTGVLRVSGTWQRAGTLRTTPLAFSAQWEGAQLGQVTKLLSGGDRGWRGTVRFAVNLAGTPADLLVTSDASVDDFHRYDIAAGGSLRLRTHCDAHYSSIDRGFHDVHCQSPVGAGLITATGSLARVLSPPRYDFAVAVEHVPVQSLLGAVRRVKKDLPLDLLADGIVDGTLYLSAVGDHDAIPKFSGSGTTSGLRLRSASNKTDLRLDEIPLNVVSGRNPKPARATRDASRFAFSDPDRPHLVVGPFKLDHSSAVNIRGWLTRQGYSFSVAGEGSVKHILQLARTFALPSPQPAADGTAKLDLQIAGDWEGFAPPKTVGSAQLKSVRLELRGLGGPLEIDSAAISLQPDRINVQGVSASIADSQWTGSLSLPRFCVSLSTCPITFNLQADEIVTEDLSRFLNPAPKTPWYRFLAPESNAQSALLARLRASGKVSANRLAIHSLTGSHVSANLTLNSGVLHISDLRGDVLGGKHRGDWDVDFTAKPPSYTGSGAFDRVSLDQLATAMHDRWLSGTGNATYQVKSEGAMLPDLLAAADGALQFDLRDGTLSHLVVDGSPMRLHRFSGKLALHAGEFQLQDGRLDSAGSIYLVSGTSSWSRQLDIKLARDGAPSLSVTGTLARPHVTPSRIADTEAALQH